MSVRSRLNEILKSYGLDNEHATKEVLELMQNPHGLSPQKVDEGLQTDRDVPHDKSFDVLYPLSTVLGAVEYGMNYALNSQHSGFVPKGNVLQWLMNLRFVDGLKPTLLKFDVEQCVHLLETVEKRIENLSDENYDRDLFESYDDHKYNLELLQVDLSTYISNNK